MGIKHAYRPALLRSMGLSINTTNLHPLVFFSPKSEHDSPPIKKNDFTNCSPIAADVSSLELVHNEVVKAVHVSKEEKNISQSTVDNL